jgi:hypothetical protein
MHIRLLIHRSALFYFARHPIENTFFRSLAASSACVCVDCAHEMITLAYEENLNYRGSLKYNTHYVFAALSVLYILRQMDGGKQSLLTTSEHIQHQGDDFRLALDILRSASQSSSLARHYAGILRQLSHTSNDRALSDDPAYLNSAVSDAIGLRRNVDPAASAYENSPFLNIDLSAGEQFAASEIDDFLFGAGVFNPAFNGLIGGDGSDLCMELQ